MNKGYFITTEGPDGAGKSTQIRILVDYLRSRGRDVVVTREPGGTSIGEQIREIILSNNNINMDPMAEALLYSASRAQHVREIIMPALDQGKVVICDRFVDSSIVYQGIGRNLGIEKIQLINDIATQGIVPDVTLLFKLEPEIGLNRKKRRNKGDRLEMEAVEFHKKVYNGYKQLEALYPERIIPIDASFDIKTISSRVIEIIDNLLKEGE